MNVVRERYAPAMPLDWGPGANRFQPLTHCDAKRSAPMAVRRTVPAHKLASLRCRWFAVGCLTTAAVTGIGYGLALLIGSLLP